MSPEFKLTDLVKLKTDVECKQRMITAYTVSLIGIEYKLSLGDSCSWHYAFEIEVMQAEEKKIGFK